MTTNEAMLLQMYDSEGELDARGRLQSARCAHSSFELAENGEELRTRESIEVRCIVLSSK